MKRTTRDRLVLPILLPVGILLVMALALYGFSRILLSVSHNAATATALVVALAIVVVAAVVAARRFVRPSSLAGLVGAVTGVAMLAGGVAIASISTEGEGGEGDGGGQVVEIVAVNIAFQQTTVTVPAGEPFQIVFKNQDAGVQHNVQIFDNPDFAGTPLFSGDLITGVSETTYDVPALEPGSYPFNCLVHPNMVGTIEAVEGGGDGGGGGPSIAVAAANIAFDTDTIELPADTPSTIVFDNRDAGVQHNIAIYTDDSMSEALFEGELVTGPVTVEYSIPPLPPGEYYFVCIVHPAMNGTVIVGGEGGGAGGGPEPPENVTPSPVETLTDAPTPVPTGDDVTIEVAAQGISFDTAEIVLPANAPATIHFVNNDAGVQHNIAIYADETMTEQLFNGELVTGVADVDYQVPPLEPGTYYFVCVVHPNMNGIATVE